MNIYNLDVSFDFSAFKVNLIISFHYASKM
jgi:hypothetical protein